MSYTKAQLETQLKFVLHELMADKNRLQQLHLVPIDIRDNHRRRYENNIAHYETRIARIKEQIKNAQS